MPLQSPVHPPGRSGHLVLCGGNRYPPDYLLEQGTQGGRFYVDRPTVLCRIYRSGVSHNCLLM
jgi:hypothetical protein